MRGEETVGGAIGHGEDAADTAVEHRLATERFFEREFLARDADLETGGLKALRIVAFVFGRDDKHTARIFDAVRMRAPQDTVFFDALDGALRVLDDIAPARVQQTVVAAGGAVREVALFHEHHAEAAQRSIPGHAGARGAAADNEDIRLYYLHGTIFPSGCAAA